MVKRWNVLLAGVSGVGKSSLIAALCGNAGTVAKTQALVFHGTRCIDLPGEYLMHPQLRRNFLTTALDARAVLFLQGADMRPGGLPADFLRNLGKTPVIGVISRIDAARANPPAARRELSRLGLAEPFFAVSIKDEQSLEVLRQGLAERGLWTEQGTA